MPGSGMGTERFLSSALSATPGNLLMSRGPGSARACTPAKFEQNLVPSSSQSTQGSIRSFRNDYFSSKRSKKMYKTTAGHQQNGRSRNIPGAARNSTYKTLQGHVSSSQNQQIGSERSGLDLSRPGSVTSLFTACSVGNNMHSRNQNSLFGQHSSYNSGSLRSEEENEREIVQAIEENQTLGLANQRNQQRNCRGRIQPKKKIFRDMYLITEIESDLEMSKESLNEKSTDSTSLITTPYQSLRKNLPKNLGIH